MAIAPRLSILLPTGSSSRRLGSGEVGAQLNVPVSVILGRTFVSHWNAGVMALPRATTYNLGASVIWLARPTFNVMMEVAWADQDGAHLFLLNPGIRWAYNFPSGLQIGRDRVSGVGPSRGDRSAFLYLSFEHPFRSKTAPK